MTEFTFAELQYGRIYWLVDVTRRAPYPTKIRGKKVVQHGGSFIRDSLNTQHFVKNCRFFDRETEAFAAHKLCSNEHLVIFRIIGEDVYHQPMRGYASWDEAARAALDWYGLTAEQVMFCNPYVETLA